MPLKIAAAARSTEMAPVARAAPGLAGKPSRVMPRNETSSAQAARMMPQTWNAFTRGRLPDRLAVALRNARPPTGRTHAGGRGREPVGMGPAARRLRWTVVRVRIARQAAAAVAQLGHGRILDRPPDDPEQHRDRNLQHDREPENSPEAAAHVRDATRNARRG